MYTGHAVSTQQGSAADDAALHRIVQIALLLSSQEVREPDDDGNRRARRLAFPNKEGNSNNTTVQSNREWQLIALNSQTFRVDRTIESYRSIRQPRQEEV